MYFPRYNVISKSQFHQHFTSSFYADHKSAKKETVDLTVFLRFWDLRA